MNVELPRLVVLSRQHVQGYRGSEPYVVISIRPPDMSPVKLRLDPMRRARINVVFNDVAPQWGHTGEREVLFTAEQAARIAAFVLKHKDATIVINCIAGISRSAGVAIGIRTALGFDSGEFGNAPFDPNPHVRELMHNELVRALERRGTP